MCFLFNKFNKRKWILKKNKSTVEQLIQYSLITFFLQKIWRCVSFVACIPYCQLVFIDIPYAQSTSQNYCVLILRNTGSRASLVAQWLRICLPMQGTRVWALVWEDPTCRGATRPMSHNYWACASGACAPQQERLRQWEGCAPRWRVAPACCN